MAGQVERAGWPRLRLKAAGWGLLGLCVALGVAHWALRRYLGAEAMPLIAALAMFGALLGVSLLVLLVGAMVSAASLGPRPRGSLHLRVPAQAYVGEAIRIRLSRQPRSAGLRLSLRLAATGEGSGRVYVLDGGAPAHQSLLNRHQGTPSGMPTRAPAGRASDASPGEPAPAATGVRRATPQNPAAGEIEYHPGAPLLLVPEAEGSLRIQARGAVWNDPLSLWELRLPLRGESPCEVLPPEHLAPAPALDDDDSAWDIRPYRPGDGLGQIHWKQSARVGELLTKSTHHASTPSMRPARGKPAQVPAAPTPLRPRGFAPAACLTAAWALGLVGLTPLIVPSLAQLAILAVLATAAFLPALLPALIRLASRRPPTRARRGLALPLSRLAALALPLATAALIILASGQAEPWLHDPAREGRLLAHNLATTYPPVELTTHSLGVPLIALLLTLASLSLALEYLGGRLALGQLVPATALLLPPLLGIPGWNLPLMAGFAALILTRIALGAPHSPGRPTAVSNPRRHPLPSRARHALSRRTLTTGVCLAAFALAATTTGGTLPAWQTPALLGGNRPNVTLNLTRDLTQGGPQSVFRYRGAPAGQQMRFTLGVITMLSGSTWVVRDEQDAPASEPRLTLGGDDEDTPLGERVDVEIENLRSTHLPTLAATVRLSALDGEPAASQWHWIEGTTTLAAPEPTSRGLRYTLEGWSYLGSNGGILLGSGPAQPGLRSAPTHTEPIDSETLALPSDFPSELHRQAQQITEATESWFPLTQAAALADYFHGNGFTYTTSAPGDFTGEESPSAVVSQFLLSRQGYCIHYAAAFTLMARSLGIPTRIAIGYASVAGSGEWTAVPASALHAWPEVWDYDYGWVPFEPTPGGAGGAGETDPAGGAAPTPASSAAPSARAGSEAAALASTLANADAALSGEGSKAPSASATASAAAASTGFMASLSLRTRLLLGSGALLTATAALALALRRRLPGWLARAGEAWVVGRIRHGRAPASAAWEGVRRVAARRGLLDGALADLTLDTAAEHLAQACEEQGLDACAAQVRELVSVVNAERYGGYEASREQREHMAEYYRMLVGNLRSG